MLRQGNRGAALPRRAPLRRQRPPAAPGTAGRAGSRKKARKSRACSVPRSLRALKRRAGGLAWPLRVCPCEARRARDVSAQRQGDAQKCKFQFFLKIKYFKNKEKK